MKLIVGLGNPGEKHRNNRHNVGYMVIDEILKSLPKDIIIAKTDVFMNESGVAVKKFMEKYNVEPGNLYIIHDDLDILLGNYKIQRGKGPKDHKGIQSVEKELETSDFWRVRIGVDNRDPDNHIPGEKYVLQDFTSEEAQKLEKVVKTALKDLKKLWET